MPVLQQLLKAMKVYRGTGVSVVTAKFQENDIFTEGSKFADTTIAVISALSMDSGKD